MKVESIVEYCNKFAIIGLENQLLVYLSGRFRQV